MSQNSFVLPKIQTMSSPSFAQSAEHDKRKLREKMSAGTPGEKKHASHLQDFMRPFFLVAYLWSCLTDQVKEELFIVYLEAFGQIYSWHYMYMYDAFYQGRELPIGKVKTHSITRVKIQSFCLFQVCHSPTSFLWMELHFSELADLLKMS